MPAFRTRGSTGPAPTTVWMSYVADRYTMLSPYDDTGSGFATTTTSLPACTLTNRFNVHGASFGALSAAPDGTNTAQKIVEDTSNGQHYIQAGWNTPQNPGFLPFIRWAYIFKAAERTRFAIQLNSRNASSTATVGFDLAGGQIAYGPIYTGGGSTGMPIINQVIYPVGSGYFLCFVDVGLGTSGTELASSCRLLLDNGSGIVAQSTTYVGTGTSGIIGWKASTLPVQAWNIVTQTFFDGFDDPTLSNIDVNNTFAPGKDWYVQAEFTGWFSGGPIPPGTLSASGSILHVPAMSNSGVGFNAAGALTSYGNSRTRYPSPGVGRGWAMPFLFETRLAYAYSLSAVAGDFSNWGGSTEWGDLIARNPVIASGAMNGFEIDYVDTNQNFSNVSSWEPVSGGFFYHATIGTQIGTSSFTTEHTGGTRLLIGYPPYQSTLFAYGGGSTVASGGNFYSTPSVANPGVAPPGAPWTPYNYPGTMTNATGPFDPNFITDPSQQHVYTTMMLPYNRVTKDRGCQMNFYDGVFRWLSAFWGPNIAAPGSGDAGHPGMHTSDWQHAFQMFWQQNNSAGNGYDMFLDHVRVSQ